MLMRTEKKALLCSVTPLAGNAFSVKSPSGSIYTVALADEGATATCSCPWGQIHPRAATEKGCSHMRAVWRLLTVGETMGDILDMVQKES